MAEVLPVVQKSSSFSAFSGDTEAPQALLLTLLSFPASATLVKPTAAVLPDLAG